MKSTPKDQVVFPVIAIKESVIEVFHGLDDLQLGTRRNLRRGGRYDDGGPRLIDSGGMEYRVRSASFVRDTGRRAFPGLFAPRLIELDLDLEVVGQRSVPEARAALIGAVECDPEVWSGATGSTDEILAAIRGASSMKELLRVLEGFLAP